ncbi:MAG: glycosyltransferase [Planctomycetes bacterium]|nr:glycosyltransferase [Planctomycetota bacterium]MCC7064571.1 glycosyltransferase [Planctomycetota bacterium]
MDVLHIIHQFPPESRGGSESYLFDVAQRQRARGLDVAVLSGSKHCRERVLVEPDLVEGLPVHRLHRDDLYFDHHAKMWHPQVEATFAELLQQWRPKLVHVHHWVRLTCNLVEICARYGIPAVVTLHDYYTSCPRAFRRREGDEACRRPISAASCGDCVPRYGHESAAEIGAGIELFRDHYRAELSLAHAVFVAVGSTADLLAGVTGVPRDRYAVLPLGYRPRFAGQPKLMAPASGERWRFAFWGGVGRHKGVDVLVRAFRLLQAQRPGRAELHVLGGAESDAFGTELRKLAEGLPVTFHGAFDAAQLRLAAPHVGVFPSTCIETFGLVLDECFELGLPCITSDLGALPERAGAAGLRVRAGDERSLAAAMQQLLDEPELWARLQANIPAPSPSLDAHVDALLAAYERARTQPPPPRFVGPVDAHRRVMFLMQQRESALGRAISGGPR